jgi:myo-inositol-1(or 4)-monophosphatase
MPQTSWTSTTPGTGAAAPGWARYPSSTSWAYTTGQYTRAMSGPGAAAAPVGLGAELAAALACADAATPIVRRHYEAGESGWQKTEDERVDDPVTRADLEADAAIRALIRERFPGDGIVTEEADAVAGGPRTWIVDPMDGTREFVDRVPEFAVSIALVECGEPLVAVVANPISRIAVCAARGAGCWRGGERMQVSECRELSLATAIASRSETERGDWDTIGLWFAHVRRMGSIAWKLSAVACSVGDLNVSVHPKHTWDVCAGDLLMREAGGVYLDREGRAADYADPHAILPGRVAGQRELVMRFLDRASALPDLLREPRTGQEA